MKTHKNLCKQIGEIGVDAGLCWIGDPCYILHTDQPPKAIGKDWGEFCNTLDLKSEFRQYDYDLGHPGLGVVVSTGYGDGTYPVFAEFNEDGRSNSWRGDKYEPSLRKATHITSTPTERN